MAVDVHSRQFVAVSRQGRVAFSLLKMTESNQIFRHTLRPFYFCCSLALLETTLSSIILIASSAIFRALESTIINALDLGVKT